jgi:hypothetical protein
MRESQHTPGPWTAKKDRRRWNPSYVETARAHVADVMPCSVVDKKNDLEAEANAHLISAAPELLEMAIWAERVLAPFSKDPAEKSGISRLRAVIAKATGK